MSIIIVILQFA